MSAKKRTVAHMTGDATGPEPISLSYWKLLRRKFRFTELAGMIVNCLRWSTHLYPSVKSSPYPSAKSSSGSSS
jgi:hypothetical protein